MSLVIKRVCDACGKELKMPTSPEEYCTMMFKSQFDTWIFTKSATGMEFCKECARIIDNELFRTKMEFLQRVDEQ